MAMPKITEFLFDNEDYFAAKTEDGGARFGMKGHGIIQVPPHHVLCAEILTLTEDQAEAFFDRMIETGFIPLA